MLHLTRQQIFASSRRKSCRWVDHESGPIRLDRTLFTATQYLACSISSVVISLTS